MRKLGGKVPKKGVFCQFFFSFFPVLGVILELPIVLREKEIFGFQEFGKRSGTVGQLGQLKISMSQNTKKAQYLYN